MIRFFFVGFVFITFLLLISCGTQLNENDPRNDDKKVRSQKVTENSDIVGIITNITQASDKAKQHGRICTLLVEGVDQNGIEDRALVTVTNDTQIFMQDSQPAAITDLQEGLRVEVKFTGPVGMSHPVMATAGHIRIIE